MRDIPVIMKFFLFNRCIFIYLDYRDLEGNVKEPDSNRSGFNKGIVIASVAKQSLEIATSRTVRYMARDGIINIRRMSNYEPDNIRKIHY